MYQAIKIRLLSYRVLSLLLCKLNGYWQPFHRKLRAARRSQTAGAGSTTISARR